MSENNPQARNTPSNLKVATYTEISGPIPAPQILQQYNSIVPGAAERIIRMAEKQSDHRMYLERKVIDSGILKSYFGMIIATGIAVYGLYIAKEISINGNPWAAGIIAALDLGGLISVAIYNGLVQKKEREKRRETSSTTPASKKN
jgi:uncharacterized membrane protein